MKAIVQMAMRAGRPIQFGEVPELLPGLSAYLTAYNRLSTERPYGQMPGPIPFSKIEAYAEKRGFEVEHFANVIARVDEWELGEMGKAVRIGQPKQSGQTTQKRPR